MQFRHDQLGIVGDRGTGASLRIEIAIETADGQSVCVPLHDEATVGSFARVFPGQLRQGNFRFPAAIKVQRDSSLTREKCESVAAKFDTERAAYLRARGSDATERLELPVVRFFDLTPDAGSGACASLPPSVVCHRARHALHPRCSDCQTPLEESDPWAQTAGERHLVCPGCGRRFADTDAVKAEVVAATARRDRGCDGCAATDDECRRSAHFLNFFPARVLVFELLDLDLEDYLAGAVGSGRKARHAAFWQARDRATPDAPTGERQLAEITDLFAQLLAGVRHLHALGIFHLDLKPRNVCLTWAGGRPVLRVIDLGFALDPEGMEYLRQVQGARLLDTPYAAPEVRHASYPLPSSRALRAACVPSKGGAESVVSVPAGDVLVDSFDPWAVTGDVVEVIPLFPR